jgi:hypothetical protein
MLSTFKHNSIPTPKSTNSITHIDFNNSSELKILESASSDTLSVSVITTSDILTEFLACTKGMLINTDIVYKSGSPVFILREICETVHPDNTELPAMWRIKQENNIRSALNIYEFAILNGSSTDKAALILPAGNLMVKSTIVLKKDISIDREASKECLELIEILNNLTD